MESLSPAEEALLRAFARAVVQSPHNLVSKRAKQELWDRHITESVAFARGLPAGPRLLDVGSGGGLPGVVIAAVRPDLEVTLLDASTKKVGFLTAVGRQLGLDYRVLHGRAEDIAEAAKSDVFDLVTARAVAPMSRLLGWTLPFLRPGGQLHAIKGAAWQDELSDAAQAIRDWDADVVATPATTTARDDTATPMVLVVQRGSMT